METKPKTETKTQAKKPRWYIRLPFFISQLPQLNPLEKMTLAYIIDHIGSNDFGYPSEGLLARECGTSRTSEISVVARLVNRELIETKPGENVKSFRYYEGTTLKLLRGAWDASDKPTKRRAAKALENAGFTGPTYLDAARAIFAEVEKRKGIKSRNQKPIKALEKLEAQRKKKADGRDKPLNARRDKPLNRNVISTLTPSDKRLITERTPVNQEDQGTGDKVEIQAAGQAAGAALARPNNSNNKPHKPRVRLEQDKPVEPVAFPHELLIAEIRTYLGDDFGDGLSRDGRIFQLGCLSDRLVEVSRWDYQQTAEQNDIPRRLAKDEEKSIRDMDRLMGLLHELLTPAVEQAVSNFDGLMAYGLWDETFPGWRAPEKPRVYAGGGSCYLDDHGTYRVDSQLTPADLAGEN